MFFFVLLFLHATVLECVCVNVCENVCEMDDNLHMFKLFTTFIYPFTRLSHGFISHVHM